MKNKNKKKEKVEIKGAGIGTWGDIKLPKNWGKVKVNGKYVPYKPEVRVETPFIINNKKTGYRKALDAFCYLVTCAALSLILVVFALAWVS